MVEISRRNFCAGLAISALSAPYVVRNSDVLMPVRERLVRIPITCIMAARNHSCAPAGAKFPFLGSTIPDGYERVLGVPRFEYLSIPGGESWFDMYPKVRKAAGPLFEACEDHNLLHHEMERSATVLDRGIMRTQESLPVIAQHYDGVFGNYPKV